MVMPWEEGGSRKRWRKSHCSTTVPHCHLTAAICSPSSPRALPQVLPQRLAVHCPSHAQACSQAPLSEASSSSDCKWHERGRGEAGLGYNSQSPPCQKPRWLNSRLALLHSNKRLASGWGIGCPQVNPHFFRISLLPSSTMRASLTRAMYICVSL